MSDCVSFQLDFDAYRDETLDDKRRVEVHEHLQGCSACQREIERAASIERELRNQALNWTASAGLWQRIKHNAEQKSRVPLSASLFFQARWAATLLLVVTLGMLGFNLMENRQESTPDHVATALVNEFHTFVVSHRELDYQDSRPAGIRQWFANKVNFRVPLPVKTPDLQLAGGRLCNMFDQRIASFMYRIDGAWVSLYIMRSKAAGLTMTERALLLQGYGYIDWENQGLQYSLVGDVSIDKLLQIANSLQATQLSTNLTAGWSAALLTRSSATDLYRNYGNYDDSTT